MKFSSSESKQNKIKMSEVWDPKQSFQDQTIIPDDYIWGSWYKQTNPK